MHRKRNEAIFVKQMNCQFLEVHTWYVCHTATSTIMLLTAVGTRKQNNKNGNAYSMSDRRWRSFMLHIIIVRWQAQ